MIEDDAAPRRFVVLPAYGFTSVILGTARQLHAAWPDGAPGTSMRVIDSVRDDGPKLVEMGWAGELRLRRELPGLKIVPVTRYDLARVLPAVERPVAADRAATRVIVRRRGGGPVPGARVVAFTSYRHREGASAIADRRGEARLTLGAGTRLERLYVFADEGCWGSLRRGVALEGDLAIELQPIDLDDPSLLLRRYYGGLPGDGGREVTVGIVDTGIARAHPALPNATGGRNVVTDELIADRGAEGEWGPAATDGAHGTHVAGIVGGSLGGWRGVAPGVTLRSYRVFPNAGGGATNYDVLKAIDLAVDDGCEVINLSLGGGEPDEGVRAAIGRALSRGTVVVAAAGNDGRKPVSYPAAWPGTVAVTAMGRRGSFPGGSTEAGDVARPFGRDDHDAFMAEFSNIGPQVDLVGPGVGIVSTVPETGFAAMSGTSMSCPAVAGFAAYLLGHASAIRGLSGEERSRRLIELLYASGRPFGFGRDYEAFGIPLAGPAA